MHAVKRSPEPDFFEAVRCRYDSWSELYSTAGEEVRTCRSSRQAPCCTAYLCGLDGEGVRREIRNSLRDDFLGICGYCEQDCSSMVTVIEHFRPRTLFPDEWITWVNLGYACQRCDDQKGDNWPRLLSDPDSSYSYVNPSVVAREQPAEQFFEYYLGIPESSRYSGGDDVFVPGQIMPSEQLSPNDWWRADRTIVDLDLNSDSNANVSGEERLPYLRNVYLETLIDGIEADLGELNSHIEAVGQILRDFSKPNQPFSSYVAAFTRSLGVQVS